MPKSKWYKILRNFAFTFLELWYCVSAAILTMAFMGLNLNDFSVLTIGIGTIVYMYLFKYYVDEIFKSKMERQNETNKHAD